MCNKYICKKKKKKNYAINHLKALFDYISAVLYTFRHNINCCHICVIACNFFMSVDLTLSFISIKPRSVCYGAEIGNRCYTNLVYCNTKKLNTYFA